MEEPTQPQIVTGNSSSKLSKIAPIILGVVLLIVLSELAFLWYSQRGKASLNSSSINEIPLINDFVQETPRPEVTGGTLFPEKGFAFSDSIQQIKDLGKEEFVRSAIASFTVKGNVLEASLDQREFNGIFYSYRIKIENATGGSTLTYLFTESEIANANMFYVSGEKVGQKLGFDEIKPGQFVSMKIIYDLLDITTDSELYLEVGSF